MQKIRRKMIGVSIFFCFNIVCTGQNVLKLKKPKVYYTSTISAGTFVGGYIFTHSIKGLSKNDIDAVDINDLSRFNRQAVKNYSLSARAWSDVSAIGTAALPGLLSFHRKVRGDFFVYNTIYAQALVSTMGQVMLLKAITKKERPLVYNTNVPIEEKIDNDARFSFPSGHTAIAATASYFFATTYALYFPKSKNKKWVWIGAAVLPIITGYLRYRAGKHFIADIAGGYVIGAANGIVFPLLFKIGNK